MRPQRGLIVLTVLAVLGSPGCALVEASSRASSAEQGAQVRPSKSGASDDPSADLPPPSLPPRADVPPLGSTRSTGGRGSAAIGPFSRARAMTDVRRLANDIGPRVRAGRGERLASYYIARRFRSLGYEVRTQRYRVDGGRSRNVIASWPGAMRYPVVIGAHMDTVRGSPGANDNASGVAVILELARLLAGRRQARFVQLVAFGSEEYGRDGRHHVGSQVYVNRLGPSGRRKLAGMVSVDMIADGRPLLIGTAGIGPEVVARRVYREAVKAGVDARYVNTCDCSDNGPFERAGIPGALAWSGLEPDYHSPSDTPPNLNPHHLGRTGRALRAFVVVLGRNVIARFRRY